MCDHIDSGGVETYVPGNLPPELTSLIGRRRELAELSALLADNRLLTLVGPGGCGKSRLGLALAEERRAELPGGAWWVDLASVADGKLVAQHVAAALELPLTPPDPAAAIAWRLREEGTLLVLDNCELVAGASAELIAGLLGACPALRVIATSRRSLGVAGEQLFRVGGLAVTASGEVPAEPGAVELFLERAARFAPSFTVSHSTAVTVAHLCRRLDGMPLAIELAAARAPVLAVEQIAERLEHDFGLLRHAGRAAPARHQTPRVEPPDAQPGRADAVPPPGDLPGHLLAAGRGGGRRVHRRRALRGARRLGAVDRSLARAGGRRGRRDPLPAASDRPALRAGQARRQRRGGCRACRADGVSRGACRRGAGWPGRSRPGPLARAPGRRARQPASGAGTRAARSPGDRRPPRGAAVALLVAARPLPGRPDVARAGRRTRRRVGAWGPRRRPDRRGCARLPAV